MNLASITDVLTLIVVLGIITTIVSRPTSAQVVRAFGDAFTGSIRAAMGK